jgi:NAD(P)-dependent dehydrogenase (short-subunit alcohol dehydrogenase family)
MAEKLARTKTLEGRIALVTGASRGIGKGCALELAALGARVYLTGRTVEPGTHPRPGPLGATVAEIEAAGGSAVALACDHRDDAQTESVFERIAADISSSGRGRLDLLVNNAFLIPKELTQRKPFWQVPLSNWDDMLDVGTRSAYVASVYAARLMVEARNGLIVNISSSGATEYAWHVAYGVGKCALDRLTADTAHELRRHDVAVVSLWPGFVRTERIDVGVATGALPANLDATTAESPRFCGRAVCALATAPDRMDYSGKAVSARELAERFGFRDVDGRLPPGPLRHR